jgi:hypothetical protein
LKSAGGEFINTVTLDRADSPKDLSPPSISERFRTFQSRFRTSIQQIAYSAPEFEKGECCELFSAPSAAFLGDLRG